MKLTELLGWGSNMISRYLICLLGLFAFAPQAHQVDTTSGTIRLDKDGCAIFPLTAGYLDTHLCSVGDGSDDITISFSAKFFIISGGKEDQSIGWACVPISKDK